MHRETQVFYSVYVRSFNDSNNDGIGDLDGITARLDYLSWLGVDGIIISPIFLSPQTDFGFDVTDHEAIQPELGDFPALKKLVDSAHKVGIKVLMELVINHTSDQHPWFRQSLKDKSNPKADWYVWADAKPDGTPPNNWQCIFGSSAWRWHPSRGQYFLHNTFSNQPDLNFHHPAVQDAVLAMIEGWLKHGIDGFRIDSVNLLLHDEKLRSNPAKQLPMQSAERRDPRCYQKQRYNLSRPDNIHVLRRIRGLCDQYGDKILLGSLSDPDPFPVIDSYTSEGDALDAANLFESLSLCTDMQEAGDHLSRFEHAVHPGMGCWSLSNHDIARTVSRWSQAGNQPEAARLLIAFLLSLRGILTVYQGEELGLCEAEVDESARQDKHGMQSAPGYHGRDGCRTPMPWHHEAANLGFSDGIPWLPPFEPHRPFTVDNQIRDPQSVLHFSRAFLAWRKEQPALQSGGQRILAYNHALMVLERSHPNQTLICAFNASPVPARVQLNLPSGASGFDAPQTGASEAVLEGDVLLLGPWQAWFGIPGAN